MDIVSDFDFTLTRKEYDRQGGDASYGVISKSPYSSQKFKDDSRTLYEYYAPIERRQDLTHEEKSKFMDEWYTKNLDLISKQNFTESQMLESCFFCRIAFRHDFKNLVHSLKSSNVNFYIMSAGIKLVIDNMLKEVLKNDEDVDFCKVITNYEVVSSDGGKAYRLPCVTTTNKSVHFNLTTYPSLRKNVIVCGDNIEDIKMVEKTGNKSILKFGYFNKIKNV